MRYKFKNKKLLELLHHPNWDERIELGNLVFNICYMSNLGWQYEQLDNFKQVIFTSNLFDDKREMLIEIDNTNPKGDLNEKV